MESCIFPVHQNRHRQVEILSMGCNFSVSSPEMWKGGKMVPVQILTARLLPNIYPTAP